jgi:glycerophosphoryl diester phosphodiesterase
MGPRQSLSFRSIIAGAWADFRRGWMSLLSFAVGFKVLSGFVLAPAAAWLLTRLVATSGHTAVSNTEIIRFITSPAGALAALVLGIELVALELLGETGILAIARLKIAGERVTLGSAVTATIAGAAKVLRLGAVQFVALVIVASPFIILGGLTYFAFLSRSDINYYLANKPPAFYAALVCAAILFLGLTLIGIALYVRWSLALPILIFESLPPLAALKASSQRVRGASWRVGVLLLGWHAFTIAVGWALLAGHRALAAGILDWAGESPSVVLPVAVTLFAVHGLIAGAVGCAAVIGHGLLLLRLYRATGGALDEAAAITEIRLGRGLVRANIAALLAFALFGSVAGLAFVQTLDAPETIEITGHRGYETIAPENTLASFQAAIDAGVDWIELDVQLSSDGTIIVLHDRDFLRVAGDRRRPGQMTLADIQQLDASQPKRFGPKYAGERIATLQQVLDLARGRVNVNIELKIYGGDRRVAAAVADVVRAEEFEEQCLIASLDVPAAREAKRRNPKLTTAAIVTVAVGDLAQLDVDVLSVNRRLINESFLREARDRGKGVLVWTVNDPRAMENLIELGAGRIITNNPTALVRLRDERAELGVGGRLIRAARHWLGIPPRVTEDTTDDLRP